MTKTTKDTAATEAGAPPTRSLENHSKAMLIDMVVALHASLDQVSKERALIAEERERLQSDVQSAETMTGNWHQAYKRDAERADTLAKELDRVREERRETVGDLKRQLRALELENARLGGWIERTDSDDQAREGHVEAGSHVTHAARPKRPPAPTVSTMRMGAITVGDEPIGRDMGRPFGMRR